MTNRGALGVRKNAQFGDPDCRAERAISHLFADVNPRTVRPNRAAGREVKLWHAYFIIFEVAGALILSQKVHPWSQILRRLPGEVVVRVVAAGDPDVDTSKGTWGPIGRKKHQVAIARERRDPLFKTRIDCRSQIDGRTPLRIARLALRDVDVFRADAETARPVRGKVQAEPIFRDRRSPVHCS